MLARDAAVMALLYGSGLRISEALSIKAKDAPVTGRDAVTVTGKGGKTRMTPVIPAVQQAVRNMSRSAPTGWSRTGRCFAARRVGH